MDQNGNQLSQLTTQGGSSPAWSPDGSQITFTRGNEIFVMDSNGSNKHSVTAGAHQDSDPAWAPDGRKIAFDSNQDGNVDIFTIDTDGSGLNQLTTDPGVDVGPAWQALPASGK